MNILYRSFASVYPLTDIACSQVQLEFGYTPSSPGEFDPFACVFILCATTTGHKLSAPVNPQHM